MFYGPIIIQESAHLDATKVGYLLAAFNFIGAFAMLLNAIHSDRTQERYWQIIPICRLMVCSFLLCGSSGAPIFVVPGVALLIFSNSAMQGPL